MFYDAVVKEMEKGEVLAIKLAHLGISSTMPILRCNIAFQKSGFFHRRIEKRDKFQVEVYDWIFSPNLENFREIEKKLLKLAHYWQKAPLVEGDGVSLEANIGTVHVAINILFPKDKVIATMSQLLHCKIKEISRVNYACASKNDDSEM